EHDNLKKQVDKRNRLVTAEREKNEAAAVTQQGATRELERRQQEVDYLKGLKGSEEKKMADLERQKTELRERSVAADINLKAEQERNTSLLGQLEALTKE